MVWQCQTHLPIQQKGSWAVVAPSGVFSPQFISVSTPPYYLLPACFTHLYYLPVLCRYLSVQLCQLNSFRNKPFLSLYHFPPPAQLRFSSNRHWHLKCVSVCAYMHMHIHTCILNCSKKTPPFIYWSITGSTLIRHSQHTWKWKLKTSALSLSLIGNKEFVFNTKWDLW